MQIYKQLRHCLVHQAEKMNVRISPNCSTFQKNTKCIREVTGRGWRKIKFDARSLKHFASILGRVGFRMNLNAWNYFNSPKIENQADLEVKSVEKTILRVKICEIMWKVICSFMNHLTLHVKMFFNSISSGGLNFVPVMDNLHDHFDVPSIVDAFACSTVSMCVSGSTPNVILNTTYIQGSEIKNINKSTRKNVRRKFPRGEILFHVILILLISPSQHLSKSNCQLCAICLL